MNHVDFAEAKRVVTVPDVLEACGIPLEQFRLTEDRMSGVCPLPTHQHNPIKPNAQQWKADCKKGYWLWKCFGGW